MKQTSFDLINLITEHGAFSNTSDFYKAINARKKITQTGYVKEGGRTYTSGRVGTAPGVSGVTGSFPDYLKERCGVPENKVFEARKTLGEASRLSLV